MNEDWQIPAPELPLEQGDLLLSRNPTTGNIEQLCLTITADCDISNSKFGQDIACLTVQSLEEYWKTVWAERKLSRTMETETEKMRSQLDKWNIKRSPEAYTLSSDAVVNWIKNSEPSSICADLQIPESEAEKVKSNVTAFRAALLTNSGSSHSDKLHHFATVRSCLSGKSVSECKQDAIQQAGREPLQEDVFLLPYLPQMEPRPAVIMLRQVVAIPFKSICFRASEAHSNTMFLRIGRLQPVFKYAVTQAFGILYSRIGLPDDFESRRKSAREQMMGSKWE